jgi:predicted O-methyltransferase YrrM
MKKYTHDWNEPFRMNTSNIKEINLCLEIGCFEGLTSNYIVENLLSQSGKLICVDPLKEAYIEGDLDEDDVRSNNSEFSFFKGQYSRFIENTADKIQSGKIVLYRELSFDFYNERLSEYSDSFDLIYIDGDHRPESVYRDAFNCFKLCKVGGIIIFDDYEWRANIENKSTKAGIDKFLAEFNGRYNTLARNYQMVIQKIN